MQLPREIKTVCLCKILEGKQIIVLIQDACLCKVVEGKQRVLFVCLFIFGKRPIMQKLFNLKCLYTNVMRPSEYLNNLGEVHN